jgi:ATP-dependent Clp protease ATP-binding subunit ClpC
MRKLANIILPYLEQAVFEHCTEKARLVIFFARYEASGFGSSQIESEHLLLGILHESRALPEGSQPPDVAWALLVRHKELIRKRIEGHITIREQVSSSIDIPLSNECKRVLAHAAEEAEGLSHKFIGTEHLLLGLLREPNCFATKLLNERGVLLESARTQMASPVVAKSRLR